MNAVVTALQTSLQEWRREQPPLLSFERPLVVGVSGGPDSLVLLHALLFGQRGEPLFPREHIVVGHLDHLLRPTSGEEAAFVSATCAAWNVTCYVGKADVDRLAQEKRLSLEEAARLARYQFLSSVAADAQAVVVAHNADDQAETVLMHFLRGSGLAGLRGMLPVSPLVTDPSLWLLRPLLAVSRKEIETYVAVHNLQPVYDHSNSDITFLRNRLRHQVLPFLETVSPGLRERLAQTATVVAADEAYLEQRTREAWDELVAETEAGWVRLDKRRWQSLPLSLQRRILRYAVGQLQPGVRDISFQTVEQARLVAATGQVGSQSVLPGHLLLTVEYDTFLLAGVGVHPAALLPQLASAPLPVPVPGQVTLGDGWVLRATFNDDLTFDQIVSNQDSWTVYIDGALSANLEVRQRRPGERLQLLGMQGHSRKVKDVMIDARIPASLRARWPLVVAKGSDQNAGYPVWLVGLRLDRRARVTSATEQIVRLECIRS